MDLRLFFIILFFGVVACQSNSTTKDDTSKLALSKKAYATTPSQENRIALIGAYKDTLTANPSNAVVNGQFINELAQLQVENKAFADATQSLMAGIKDYFGTSSTADNVWSLGQVYENHIKSPKVAGVIKKIYAKQFSNGANIAIAQKFAQTDTTSITNDIAALGSSMYNEKTHRVDFKAANDFIKVCELYALLKPEDAQSPEYLHKAGETARAIRSFPAAVALYDWICVKYPNYEKAPQALFLKAFTYDNDLADKAKAKSLYQDFLKRYPEDDFADDTKFLLENIDKDDEAIIKGFGEK